VSCRVGHGVLDKFCFSVSFKGDVRGVETCITMHAYCVYNTYVLVINGKDFKDFNERVSDDDEMKGI
jgi:hypothetical protein